MSIEASDFLRLDSSFRDPGGFIFSHEGIIYRQINHASQHDYSALMDSGLYKQLTDRNLLISHNEVGNVLGIDSGKYYRIIRPHQLRYVSYPYEWSFSMLKDAAILTLQIQAMALKKGLVLKDASAYNVQFVNGKPIFIDTLSFEAYKEGAPWVAYKQFCQHFLAPISLMAYSDIELGKLLVTNIDGIPLPLTSKLLPLRTWFNYSLAANIHVHAKMQQNYADSAKDANVVKNNSKLSSQGLHAMVRSLAKAINGLEWRLPKTEWSDYYDNTNYSDDAVKNKRMIVDQFLSNIPDKMNIIQDLGANTGEFSRVAAKHCQLIISQDIDPVAVEINYRQIKDQEQSNILPLVQNLFSPSPAIGWGNSERYSFVERGRCDALLALALIHHIAISNNVPLGEISKFFARLTTWLIIEFVPKNDSQVRRLLATRNDIFPDYHEYGFEQSIAPYFTIKKKEKIYQTDRILYLLKRHIDDKYI